MFFQIISIFDIYFLISRRNMKEPRPNGPRQKGSAATMAYTTKLDDFPFFLREEEFDVLGEQENKNIQPAA